MWLARLTGMGLLRASFVPPAAIRELRDYTRARARLVRERTRCYQQLEKLLEGALIKLSSAVYSMARNKTARDILEAIVAGERDPRALAARAHGNIKGGTAAITEALEGMLVGEHHPVLIRVHLDHITLLDRLAAEVEDEIEAALDAIPAAWGVTADGVPSAGPGPDAVVLPAAERLAEIPGVSLRLARAIIAGTGLDMARFQTADHLVSWAGLAPVARQSGPRQRKPSKGQGDAYLKMYCVQAANGAATTGTFLGERLRRLSRRLGGIKAKCAVGRSILGQVAGARCRAPAPSEPDLPVSRHPAQASHSGHCGLQRRCAPALPGLEGTVAGGVHQGCGGPRVPLAISPGASRPAGCGLDALAGGAHPPVLPFLRGAGQAAGVEQMVSA